MNPGWTGGKRMLQKVLRLQSAKIMSVPIRNLEVEKIIELIYVPNSTPYSCFIIALFCI